MKVKVKSAWLDVNGLHKKGDVLEVEDFNPLLMVALDDEPKTEEKPKTTKKSKK